ncbi:MAG: carbon storage regulator CsrA [Steroidobacteraceae bacterium]
MLILTRRIGETLRIGAEVSITVVGIHGHQIRVGIQAPKSIPVHREEIYLRIAARGQANHASAPPIAQKR